MDWQTLFNFAVWVWLIGQSLWLYLTDRQLKIHDVELEALRAHASTVGENAIMQNNEITRLGAYVKGLKALAVLQQQSIDQLQQGDSE